ncbi:MAG: PASTA domain-containing protein [Saprospiraceae bacterium]|nr:PASTA domain-containing protein [Saprospiraceae bacterium]
MKEFFDKYPVLKHILLAIAFVFGLVLLTMLWLRFYTNHGEKLKMPDFVNTQIRSAVEVAEDNSFEIVVADSIFKLGVQGGTVLNQNPKAGAEVKSGRKVYVTISKFTPDKVKVSDLPVLYGNDFNQKLAELGYRGFKGTIIGRKYDPGEPNHILEVYYKGKLIISQDVLRSDLEINKGDMLEFIVSDKGSGEITIPQLECLTLSEAEFILESSKLLLGDVQQRGSISDRASSYVLVQEPVYDGITKVAMGSRINLTIVEERPVNCN